MPGVAVNSEGYAVIPAESGGHWQQKHYIGDFAVITKAVTTNITEAHYLLTDHIGSVDTVMGLVPTIYKRVPAHEFGHALFGRYDDSLDNMNNSNENENPVMRSLGQPERPFQN